MPNCVNGTTERYNRWSKNVSLFILRTKIYVNNQVMSDLNNTYADSLWLYGGPEISLVTLSGSTYTIWQFVLDLLLSWSYSDNDHKSDRNML